MWSPTHINVTVHKARNLLCKGKSGTNDCYATMQYGKDRYHTSIKEKVKDPDWQEECDFALSEHRSALKIAVYHRNLLGLDKFLGQVVVPLDQFQLCERPRSRWYTLKAKQGSTVPEKKRGEIELTVAFVVHSMTGSTLGLNRTEKNQTKSVSIKSLAHSIGDKLTTQWPSRTSLSVRPGSLSDTSSGAFSAQSMLDLRFLSRGLSPGGRSVPRCRGNGTGGQNSTSPSREYFIQKKQLNTSQKSQSGSNSPTKATKAMGSCKDQLPSLASLVELSEDIPDPVFPDDDDSVESSAFPSPGSLLSGEKSSADESARSTVDSGMKNEAVVRRLASEMPTTPSKEKLNDKFKRFRDGSAIKCHTLGHPGRSAPQVTSYEMHEMEEYKRSRKELQETRNVVSNETLDCFKGCEREELVKLIVDQRSDIYRKDSYILDLEDYIDNLLVKVIEAQPKLLQNPIETERASKILSSCPSATPPSSSTPRAITTSVARGENAVSKTSVAVARKSNAPRNENKKPLIIASPFKRLQALVK